MPERNPTSHRGHELFLVLGVAGFVLAMATASAELRHSHLAARQIPITHSSLMSIEAAAAEQGDRLAERTRLKEGMGSMPRVITASSGQSRREHACVIPNNPDRDLRMILAMMAIQQRRIARASTTSEHPWLVLTEHAVAPPNAARWAEHRQEDATSTDHGVAPCPDPSRENLAQPSAGGGHGLEAVQSSSRNRDQHY
jgi:hypothetical protein